jgi:hypothetical protein
MPTYTQPRTWPYPGTYKGPFYRPPQYASRSAFTHKMRNSNEYVTAIQFDATAHNLTLINHLLITVVGAPPVVIRYAEPTREPSIFLPIGRSAPFNIHNRVNLTDWILYSPSNGLYNRTNKVFLETTEPI